VLSCPGTFVCPTHHTHSLVSFAGTVTTSVYMLNAFMLTLYLRYVENVGKLLEEECFAYDDSKPMSLTTQ
jgi:hypothetical protein